jgi:hypothetical protein
MKELTWEVEIDSDLGSLTATIKYEVNPGSEGDYDTPGERANINFLEINFEPLKYDLDEKIMLDELAKEILESHYTKQDYE